MVKCLAVILKIIWTTTPSVIQSNMISLCMTTHHIPVETVQQLWNLFTILKRSILTNPLPFINDLPYD